MQQQGATTRAMQQVESRLGTSLDDWLRREYAGGRSMGEIGQELGVDKATVSRWFRALGITPRYFGYRRKRA